MPGGEEVPRGADLLLWSLLVVDSKKIFVILSCRPKH